MRMVPYMHLNHEYSSYWIAKISVVMCVTEKGIGADASGNSGDWRASARIKWKDDVANICLAKQIMEILKYKWLIQLRNLSKSKCLKER